MKALLVNVDSRFNIALRRLRRCYIENGVDVTEINLHLPAYPHNKHHAIDASGYDKVWVSNLFEVNQGRVQVYGCPDVDVGGIGSERPYARIPP